MAHGPDSLWFIDLACVCLCLCVCVCGVCFVLSAINGEILQIAPDGSTSLGQSEYQRVLVHPPDSASYTSWSLLPLLIL